MLRWSEERIIPIDTIGLEKKTNGFFNRDDITHHTFHISPSASLCVQQLVHNINKHEYKNIEPKM